MIGVECSGPVNDLWDEVDSVKYTVWWYHCLCDRVDEIQRRVRWWNLIGRLRCWCVRDIIDHRINQYSAYLEHVYERISREQQTCGR